LLGLGRTADLFVNAPVARWFVRRRGLALGVALAGTPLGILVFYPLSQAVIDAIGWRDAWRVFGIAGAVVIAPMALLVLRRQPEDVGLLPDGDTGGGDAVTSMPTRDAEVSWNRAEAMRTPAFWLMVAGFTAFTYGWSTITIFRVPHFIERGLDPKLVAFAIAVDAAVAIGASIYLGQLLERVPARYVLVLGVAGLMVSAASLIVVDGVALLFVANIGYGFGFQTGHVAQNVMWADYFGRAHLGSIRGVALPITIGLGAIAFPVTGTVREVAGIYTPAWVVALVALAIAAAILVTVRPPVRE
jgi:MFS family permease